MIDVAPGVQGSSGLWKWYLSLRDLSIYDVLCPLQRGLWLYVKCWEPTLTVSEISLTRSWRNTTPRRQTIPMWNILVGLVKSPYQRVYMRQSHSPSVSLIPLILLESRPVFPASRVFGPIDCLVNVDSAVWGSDLGPGTHLGTHSGMDQYVCAFHLTVSCGLCLITSASIICKKTVLGTILHIKAAETGEIAPVLPIDHNLAQEVVSSVGGSVNTTLAPSRAIFGTVGLRFWFECFPSFYRTYYNWDDASGIL